MSAVAATQRAGQYAQLPITTSAYIPTSSSDQYARYSMDHEDGSYRNQAADVTGHSRSSRQRYHNNHSNSNNSPASQQYHSTRSPNQLPQVQPSMSASASSPSNAYNTSIPLHLRNRSAAPDQYDGPPPVVPTRTSSQHPAPTHAYSPPNSAPSRRTRHHETPDHSPPSQGYRGVYMESLDQRATDDTAQSAATAARSRRKDPGSPSVPHRATNTREPGHQASVSPQNRSEAPTASRAPPAPLVREHSEVINRVVVSDPRVDAERVQERVAEAQPQPVGNDRNATMGLGLVGNEGVDDGTRGAQRRQDYSRTAARRKDVQFGDYMLGQTLGEGEFGKVKLGWKKDGSSQVAIKLIRRETVATNPSRLPKIYREISILRDLAHPNIVRLHEMVETERHIGIILEYASGGELFDYILNNRYLKDPAARRLFAQLVSGVGYLHKKGIVHRDLKLENLLLDQNRNIIITDFGFANTFDPADELSDEIEYNLANKDFVRKMRLDRQDARGMRKGDLMQTSCGSPCYAAPELVVSDSLYTGRKVDVWSCGVILYAMLAGYLPFDDDPANPEGDNINLLYKYITNTPLTFPEYVSPHARDLLRRILVPDPRKRADLFEVARHSWLSDYQHVVSDFTSSTTNIADIHNSSLPSDLLEGPMVNRSVSVREPSRSTATGGRGPQAEQAQMAQEYDAGRQKSSRTRHTLQTEYVAPQTQTSRGTPVAASAANDNTPIRTRADGDGKMMVSPTEMSSKPLPQIPAMGSPSPEEYAAAEAVQPQRMPPPVRPARDVPRSTSDSSGVFATAPPTSQAAPTQTTRPSTGGSLTSAAAPTGTRSDLRLPSRGSYGQPVAPTVATTNVHGRVTQPKATRGYNISGPIPQHDSYSSMGQPMSQSASNNDFQNGDTMPPPAQAGKGHHRRSSTLSGLGERLFGRSGSFRKRESDQPRQKTGRKYPPTAMKEPMASSGPRASMESKRSFSFGLGKKRSTDLESQIEKVGRRRSFVPASFSFKGLLGGSSRDQLRNSASPQTGDFPQPPTDHVPSQPDSADVLYNSQSSIHSPVQSADGQHEQARPKVANFSRPPQAQYPQYQQHSTPPQPSHDVYGGTGVYNTAPQYQDSGYRQRPQQFQPQYPEGFSDQSRSSMQQGRPARGVLSKPNRKFNDGYDDHRGSSSGAVKKVQDFFRRRGRARADSHY